MQLQMSILSSATTLHGSCNFAADSITWSFLVPFYSWKLDFASLLKCAKKIYTKFARNSMNATSKMRLHQNEA